MARTELSVTDPVRPMTDEQWHVAQANPAPAVVVDDVAAERARAMKESGSSGRPGFAGYDEETPELARQRDAAYYGNASAHNWYCDCPYPEGELSRLWLTGRLRGVEAWRIERREEKRTVEDRKHDEEHTARVIHTCRLALGIERRGRPVPKRKDT